MFEESSNRGLLVDADISSQESVDVVEAEMVVVGEGLEQSGGVAKRNHRFQI